MRADRELDAYQLYAPHADSDVGVDEIVPVRLRLVLGAEHPLAGRDEGDCPNWVASLPRCSGLRQADRNEAAPE